VVDLRDELRRIESLPALPNTLARLLQALNEASTADELEDIVKGDEAVSAAVLRLANSAVVGVAGRTFTLAESIARIGHRNLQRIAVSLNAASVLEGRGKAYGLDRDELWRGSLAGGLACEWIARDSGLEDPGICFVTGLLRDIGKIAMDVLFPIERVRAASAAAPSASGQLEAERQVLGIDHAELGMQLAEVWRLPARLANAVRYHHGGCEEVGEFDPLPHIVHCGDMIALQLGMGVGTDGLTYGWNPRSLEIVGLDRTRIEACMEAVHAEVARIFAELSIAMGEVR